MDCGVSMLSGEASLSTIFNDDKQPCFYCSSSQLFHVKSKKKMPFISAAKPLFYCGFRKLNMRFQTFMFRRNHNFTALPNTLRGCLGVWQWLFFKQLFVPKYMPMIFFYFLKIIFDISISKRSKRCKPHSILVKKKKFEIH